MMGVVLAAGWWGDFIRWLEGHDASALVLAAFLTFLATAILAVVTAFYAKSAGRQAKASAQMAEATLRPVMVVWTSPERVDEAWGGHVYTVWYQNAGSGPAVNISFRLSPADGDWFDPPERVGMGVREEKSFINVGLALPIPDQLLVVAEYEDASHSHWSTTLRLEKEDGVLRNRESKLERIGG